MKVKEGEQEKQNTRGKGHKNSFGEENGSPSVLGRIISLEEVGHALGGRIAHQC